MKFRLYFNSTNYENPIFKTGLFIEALRLAPTTKPIIIKQLVSVVVFATITVLLLTANAYSQAIGINDDGIAPPAGINVEIDFDKAGDATTKTWLLIDGDITTANQTANLTGLDINLSDGAFNSTATNIGLNVDLSGLTGGTNYAGIFMGGNVGVGTTSPSRLFHLFSSGRTTGYIESTGSTVNDYAEILLKSNSNAAAAGMFKNSTGQTLYAGAGSLNIGTTVSENFGILTNNLLRVFVKGNDGNVGIGTTSPSALLDVNGDVEWAGGKGVLSNWTSTKNSDVDALLPGTIFGTYIQSQSSGHITIGIRSNDSNDSFSVLSDSDFNGTQDKVVLFARANGRVGIGTSTPGYQFEVSTNSAAKPTSSSWTVSSDRRLKRDVQPFTEGLDVIGKIDPVWFKYNGLAGISMEEGGVGAIAQNIQDVAPYMIKPFQYTDTITGETTTYLGVDYGAMDFVLINAIKEQQQMIMELKEKNNLLRSDNTMIKGENAAINNRLSTIESILNDTSKK
ncbi:MAG: hypothetical protein COA57_11995 [Flavobacteriales bacterium]|nr:tail fiber domain-containing protein [Bacteroidales bacterium AH-315-I05]PCJ83109.1 MAG: hypothetical protein COA57_11995 [Flavobacteriales bacterium]